MKTVPEKLRALRRRMVQLSLSHYLVPSADEHLDEYLPPRRKRREWISGFTGSAGDLLVGLDEDETLLFVDGRYHLQAERETEGSGIGVMKVGAPGAQTLRQTLDEIARRRGADLAVGFDPAVFTLAEARSLAKVVERRGGRFVPVRGHLVDELWNDRPAGAVAPLFECPREWSGEGAVERIERLRADLAERDADAIAVVKLDQIAWLLGLRSFEDVPFNPVFESFLYVDRQRVRVFLSRPERRLPRGFDARVPGLEAAALDAFLPFLEKEAARRVLVDPARTTRAVADALAADPARELVEETSPIEERKARKNAVEIECMRRANRMASAAKTRALLWLEERIEAGDTVTEHGFLEKIETEYAGLAGFRSLSFQTIAATGAHGAVVHYSGADATPLRRGELFLIDSGVQLDGGTTDDTRTVAIGEPSAEQRRVYTLVLAGHVLAAQQRFPEGTTGSSLDALARAPLWREGLDYDHGTGHGVGAFLNVHEGPFAIAPPGKRPGAAHALDAGMVTSIEPGFYDPEVGGVRIENLYLVSDAEAAHDGRRTFALEPLTFVPFDRRLIDVALLDPKSRAWVDAYHARVRETLAPLLTEAERRRLAAWTAPL